MGLFGRTKKSVWKLMRAFRTKAEAAKHIAELRSARWRRDQRFKLVRGSDFTYRWEILYTKAKNVTRKTRKRRR